MINYDIHEANDNLSKAIEIMCKEQTKLPTKVRKHIAHASNIIATWCLLNNKQNENNQVK